MTTVNFTQRIKDVLTRQLTCDFVRLMTAVNKQIISNSLDDDGDDDSTISVIAYNENIELRISASVWTHEDDCVGFPFALDTGCDCPKVRFISSQINIKYKGNHIVCFPFKENTLKKMVKQIKKEFPLSMTVCHCGEKADEATLKCRRCFIQSYTRTEDEGGNCSICLENDGVWIKTKCGHIFHQQCLIKAKAVNPVCPMCRGSIEYQIGYHHSHGMNPYNV